MHSVTGEATRKGFYVYDERRKASPDPELKKYIEKSRSISDVTIDPKVSLSHSHIPTYTGSLSLYCIDLVSHLFYLAGGCNEI
jgi:hypothetical protein